MAKRAWGEEFRTTTLCIDSYDAGVLSGRFYNPYLKEGRDFESTTQFLFEMENTLDTMDFPRAFTAERTFRSPPHTGAETSRSRERVGRKATFYIRILFRQNASWQGSVLWIEGKQEQSFRSVLELLFLLDTALKEQSAA